MEQFLTYLLYGYLAFQIFNWYLTQRVQKNMIAEIRERVDIKIRVVRLEKHENLLLAYDDENNNFLGQGLNEDEIRDRLVTRFPDKIFILNEKPFGDLESEGVKLP
jgi:hypothetical protein